MSEPGLGDTVAPREDATEVHTVRRSVASGRLREGETLGRYVVLACIGEGGMGTVYRCYDPRLRREVALKRLHTGALDDLAEARLLREAQAMARLHHPNVVTVHDVEVLDEGAFVAMEYIAGDTLRQWLESRPSVREICSRFRQAGQGLAAAHAAGIVHRDFKPSNVLCASDGRVLVTDFGLAKQLERADDQPVVDDADFEPGDADLTRADDVLGTPLYMAPEQSAGASVDARSDQYAFCVALWQAVAGRAPFEGDLDAITGQKRRGAPALPAEVAVPARVRAVLERGLQPDPAQRWPDMTPILDALADSTSRARRTRGIAVIVVAIAVAAVGWSVSRPGPCDDAAEQLDAAWGEARRETVRAAMTRLELPYGEASAARAIDRLDAYAAGWVEQHADACEASRGSGPPARVAGLRMSCLHRARAQLAAVIDVLAEADAAVVEQAHIVLARLPALEVCEDVEALQAELSTVDDPSRAVEHERIAAELARADALADAGKYSEALSEVEGAAQAASELGTPALTIQASLSRGRILSPSGRHAEAEAAFSDALAHALRTTSLGLANDAASDLAFHLVEAAGKPGEALRVADVALGLAQRPTAPASALPRALSTRGGALRQLGRYDEAEAEQRRALQLWLTALGPDHSNVAVSRTNLGLVLGDHGRHKEAVTEHAEALRIWIAALGPDHPRVATARGNLAIALEAAGRYSEAEVEHRRTLAARIELHGPRHVAVGLNRNNLAIVLHSQGRYTEAEAEARAAVEVLEALLGKDDQRTGFGRNNLGLALDALGRLDEAEVQYREAARAVEVALGPEHPELAKMYANLADLSITTGELVDAEMFARRMLEIRIAALGPDHMLTGLAHGGLARVLVAAGRVDEAREHAERGWALVGESEVISWRRARVALALAHALPPGSKRARELVDRMLEQLRAEGVEMPIVDELKAWRAQQ